MLSVPLVSTHMSSHILISFRIISSGSNMEVNVENPSQNVLRLSMNSASGCLELPMNEIRVKSVVLNAKC